MPNPEQWEVINTKLTEVTKLIKDSGLTMLSATYGDEELNHWKYKIWIPKKDQKRKK